MKNDANRAPLAAALAGLFLAVILLLMPQAGRATDRDCLLACVATPGTSVASCAPKCNATQIDHRCLSGCIAQGTGTYACRQGCTYIKPEFLQALKRGPLPNGAQFSPIIPVGADELAPPAAPAPPALSTPTRVLKPNVQPLSPSTDYKCVAQCVNQGMNNALCTQACTY